MNRTSVYLDITIMTLLLFIGFLIPKLLDNEMFKNKKNFKKAKKKFKKNVKKKIQTSLKHSIQPVLKCQNQAKLLYHHQ